MMLFDIRNTIASLFRNGIFNKYLISSDMYKELSEADRENNKLKVNFIKDDITDLKKTSKMCLKMM